jgi:hypothetical protein
LRQETDSLVLGYGKRAENTDVLLKQLYRKPSITANQAADLLAVTLPSTISLLSKLVNNGVLIESTGFKKLSVYIYFLNPVD